MSRLLLVTDGSQLPPGRDLVDTVAGCVQVGLREVVLRELDRPDVERAALAQALAATGATVIAAHRPLPGAAGLHLPSGTAGPAGAGRCTPLGRSCHTVEEVHAAAADGVDYVTLGPYAATPSKPGYLPSLTRDDWTAAATGSPVPVLALGGISPDNAAEAVAAGVHGVAVMGAVMGADDPAAVVRALLAAVGEER